MTTQADRQSNYSPMSVLYLFIGILLTAHLFVYCHLLLPQQELPLARDIIDRLVKAISDPHIMRFIQPAKLIILGLQTVIVVGDPPKFTGKTTFTQPLILLFLGCLLFFGSDIWRQDGGDSSLLYPILTVVGYLLLVSGLYNLYRAAFDPFDGLFAKKRPTPAFVRPSD